MQRCARINRLAALVCALAWARSASAQPRFEVDAAQDRGAVNRMVYGGDLEFINQNVPEVAALASELPLWRFPGGDADGAFRWDAASSLAPRCGRPGGWTWDAVATLALRHGTSVLLETNLARSAPSNVADWVLDARRRGVTVAWVGVGNEPWGDWDAGYRTAARYAQDVRDHAAAIRARAPGTRVALAIGTSNEDAWNREAIRRAADVIDAVDYHFYPNHRAWGETTPAEVMAGAEAVGPLVARLRAMIRAEAPARSGAIEVLFGEWDGAVDAPYAMADRVTPRAYAMWSMADAIFYGAALGEMHTHGVAAAMFYEVQGYRFGAIPGDVCYAADLRVRRPKALVHQLYREHFGERLVAVTARGVPTYDNAGPTNWDGYTGPTPYVRVYASTADAGRALRMVVVNRGGAAQVSAVTFELRNFTPAARATVWEVGGTTALATNENVGGPVDAVRIQTREVAVPGAAFPFSVAPYSVAVIEVRARDVAPLDGGRRDVVTFDVTDSAGATDDLAPVLGDAGADVNPASDTPAGAPGAPSCACSVHGGAFPARGRWPVAAAVGAWLVARGRQRRRKVASSGAGNTRVVRGNTLRPAAGR